MVQLNSQLAWPLMRHVRALSAYVAHSLVQQHPQAPASCQVLPGAARCCQVPPGAARCCQVQGANFCAIPRC